LGSWSLIVNELGKRNLISACTLNEWGSYNLLYWPNSLGYGKYTGEKVSELAHGFGRWVSFKDNSIYTGQFKYGKPAGFGVFITRTED